MEREVGGGIGMGNTCKPMAVSFQCMTKSTTNKKQTNKQKNQNGSALEELPAQPRRQATKEVVTPQGVEGPQKCLIQQG